MIPSIIDEDEEVMSPLKIIYYYGMDIENLSPEGHRSNTSFNDVVEKMLINLSDEEVKELKNYPNIGLEIIEMFYFHIGGNFSSMDIFEIDYTETAYGG